MAEQRSTQPTPSEALYDRCSKAAAKSAERFRKTFNQDELIELCDSEPLDKVNDARTLMPIIQELANSKLFIVLKSKNGTCWAARPRDAATKIKDLSRDELMIYSIIEEGHENGVWIRNIKSKTGIKDTKAMDKILNRLANMLLIKTVKNVKTPMQRMYILYHLAPSEEITGGTFYDAGDLDEALIGEMSNLIIFLVRQMSWDEKKKRVRRGSSPILVRDDAEPVTAGAPDPNSPKKRKRETNSTKDIEEVAPPRKHRSHKHKRNEDTDTEIIHTQLPFQAGHEYPTTASIHEKLTNGGIIRDIKSDSLTIDEVQTLINVLVRDEKLEEVNGGYRTVRGVKFKPPGEADDPSEAAEMLRGNAFTEMPCGRCPVIDLCGTGGPVSPESCVYFDIWLGRKPAPERPNVEVEIKTSTGLVSSHKSRLKKF